MLKNNRKPIYGWGINDVDYVVEKKEYINGKRKLVWACPYYQDWKSILQRCFDPKLHNKYITYKNCTISNEWQYLSNFIKWVDSQPNMDWVNCSLDKDFLSEGNKHYGPETVVYMPRKLNTFIIDRGASRGNLMIGVSCSNKKNTPYKTYCNNPFIQNQGYVGLFITELEAHKAWQAKKHEYACQLAEQQDDPRVAKALKEKYAPDKDWTNL